MTKVQFHPFCVYIQLSKADTWRGFHCPTACLWHTLGCQLTPARVAAIQSMRRRAERVRRGGNSCTLQEGELAQPLGKTPWRVLRYLKNKAMLKPSNLLLGMCAKEMKSEGWKAICIRVHCRVHHRGRSSDYWCEEEDSTALAVGMDWEELILSDHGISCVQCHLKVESKKSQTQVDASNSGCQRLRDWRKLGFDQRTHSVMKW